MKKKKGKKGYLALKLDLSKDFDRVEWSFLIKIMQQMGFVDDWCALVHQCISTTEIQIQLNGAPCSSFKPSRGLRQGDPLSPYLFLLSMEVFTRALAHAEQHKMIQGIKIARHAPQVSHLLFADDCLLFTKANIHNVNNLLDVIHAFMQSSGQQVNFQKSSVFFSKNVHPRHSRILARRLKVNKMSLEEKYLGIPLFLNRRKTTSFSSLVDNMRKRTSRWRGRFINQTGRSTLVKTVLNAVPVHQMSIFKIPETTIEEMNKIQRQFYWNNKSNKGGSITAWTGLCKSKERGGLGFHDLSCFNDAMLAKTVWRLCNSEDQLWGKARYFPNSSLLQAEDKKSATWTWKSLYRNVNFMKQHSFWQLGNGQKIKIWEDIWVPDMNQPPIPKGQAIDDAQHYTVVSQLINSDSGTWKTDVVNSIFEDETARKILGIRVPINSKDRLVWTLTRNGTFTVRSAYHKLVQLKTGNQQPSNTDGKLWKKLWSLKTMPKIKHFLWKCVSDSVPSSERLARNFGGEISTCAMCSLSYETTDHILMHCHFTRAVLMSIPGSNRSMANFNDAQSWISS